MLLSALSRLPFSASIAPPPLPAISKAVSALLSRVTQYGGGDEALDGNDEPSRVSNWLNGSSRGC
ncbi:hypothetical protein GQ600_17611 [Phytophthora cactorum]|nr:hypothetical protein GQ600_17611 [Phytophthora cactorum]